MLRAGLERVSSFSRDNDALTWHWQLAGSDRESGSDSGLLINTD